MGTSRFWETDNVAYQYASAPFRARIKRGKRLVQQVRDVLEMEPAASARRLHRKLHSLLRPALVCRRLHQLRREASRGGWDLDLRSREPHGFLRARRHA